MSRQDGAVLHHVDTSFWEYVEKMDDDRMVCKFCGHGFAKDTAITRIKLHLAEVTGRGVKIYGKVPQDVQEAALAAVPIDGPTTWWFEDLLVLNVLSFDKVIRMMMSQKLDHATIFRFIVFRLKSGYISVTASEKCKITEVAINLLSLLDRSSLSCRGLFDILQAVSRLKNISKFYALKLEHLVGSMLDQATLDHLLVPSPHKNHHVYDVNLVLRLLKVFILEGSTMSRNQLRKVASLTDSYLIEVAPDIRLKPSKFAALIMVLPDPARESSDRLYQAIDMYLQVHVQLCEEVKMRLCSFVNHDKLSAEAFKHLKTRAGPSNNEVTNAAQQQNNEMEPLERGSFHERPSFNQADEPRGDPSQPTNDQFCSPSVNNDVSVNEATERLVQHGVGASSFVVYGNHNAISTPPQEQNNEGDNVAGDAGTTPAGETMSHAPGRIVEERIRSFEAWLMEDGTDNGTGGGVQPGAGASSFGGLTCNTNDTPGDPLPTSSTKLVGRAFEQNTNEIWSCLMDDKVSTIGIYGMGGVGKTTMLKHIHNKLLERQDICHSVYWVTVSRDFSIKRLQTIIAECIDLHFSSVDDDLRRAAKLSKELRKKQRWILILDDLWNYFELHEVGIPEPVKGCKLIMTTRSEAVCRQMNSKNNVKVNPLSNEEAWTLFMEVLGHGIPLSPQVEQVARDITRECAGLPLGIKTIAGTMKGVDGMHEWRYVLEDLKQSKVPQDRVEEEVFRILRFSYTHLRDRALQKCFLYCGLFPEDFQICGENLIDYLIDEGVLKRQKSREAEINEGYTMLDRLERACLLERLQMLVGGYYVQMHDLIRDMAIQILEENSRAIIKARAQLTELPDAEEWSEKLTSVSLMHNQIKEIHSGHSPRCPNLSTLFLCGNRELGFIADSFFKQLHGLKVLDLSRTYIECLPDSVSDLEGLTSLLLENCKRLSHVPSLKKLKALKRLDLSGARLKKIPHGMEFLSKLRYLRMNGCGENKFPGGILPKLRDLQVFILEEWFFDNYRMGKEIYAPVTVEGKEVGCLRKLESLECHFEDQPNYLEFLKSRDATQSLRTYKIVVGQLREDHDQRLRHTGGGTKMVGLGNLNINRDRDFLVISSNDIQQLICICIDAGSIGDVLPLKYRLSSCNSIESLVSSCSAPLPQPSPSYNGIFSALKFLSCYGCKSMKKLFPLVLLPYLINLEDIRVEDCEKMEEIIGGTRSDEEGAMGEESSEFKLPKLRTLTLDRLPELKSISSAKLICDSLREIEVSKCNSIEIMVPSSWSCLLNLEEITVVKCEKMEEIIGVTRSDERVMGKESISSEFKLPKLRRLHLLNLPELKSIWNAKLLCDSLEGIFVLRCEKLKRLPICLPLLENGQPSPPASLKGIWICPQEWWESTVEWEHPNAKDVLRPLVLFLATTSASEALMLHGRYLELMRLRQSWQ